MEIDDFCGTKFGNLTVIGIASKNKWGAKIYACKCSVCSLDEELFGDGVFESAKSNLGNGSLPCGCGKYPKWSDAQYRVMLARKSAGRYSVIVPDGIKSTDKIQCTCLSDGCGHIWDTSINSLLNAGRGCRKCAGSLPLTESEAIARIQVICSEKGWIFNGFENGWNNVAKTKLNLKCHCGCVWSPIYNNTINNKLGCPSCSTHGYSPDKPGTFYTYLWTNPETNHSFLKYGITNRPKGRLQDQKRNTNYIPKQLCSIPFEDGNIPANLEKVIDDHKRNNSIQSPVTKELFPDGHTETLPLSEWPFIANLIQEQNMMRLSPL